MKEIICNNRSKLSIIISIIALALGWIDAQIEKETSNTIQWIIFFAAIISLFYINFVACIDDVVYEEEPEKKENKNQISIVNFDPTPMSFHQFRRMMEAQNHKDTPAKPINRETINKLKQVKMDNINKKPAAEINAKSEGPQIEKAPEQPKIEPVKGYSLHNVHKKWRPMYQDVCSFAISSVKTENELDKKVLTWGYKFEKIRGGEELVAYVILTDGGNQRIPNAGFFAVS